MEKKSLEFLKSYIECASPSGDETHAQRIWLDYIGQDIDEYQVDLYGSVAATIKSENDFKLVIEAHADQVSFAVNYITEDGYIFVLKNGGANSSVAPSKRVKIHTEKGHVDGFFAWPAPHVKAAKTKLPEEKSIFVDVGCSSRKEVEELGIEIGNHITFIEGFKPLNHYYTGPALDNRVGGFILAEVIKRLKKENIKLSYNLICVNSVQEEVGLNGAQLMAKKISPDVALIVDVTHDTHSPMYVKKEMGDISCGKGIVLPVGPAIQNTLLRKLKTVAAENQIPVQLKMASKTTGTDTEAFAFADSDTAAALVSVPLKYMHSSIEAVHKKDVGYGIDLLFHFLRTFNPDEDLRYFK